MVDAEFWQWVSDNSHADTMRLRLSAKKAAWTDLAITQIECRKRADAKIPKELAFESFLFPTALSAEQCTSDTLAAFHAGLVSPGASVTDLTAGLGIDSFHLASTCREVTAVEIQPEVARALEHNASVLGLGNVTVVCADCCNYVAALHDKAFDVAFIDPARRGKDNCRLFSLHDCQPDVTWLLPKLARIARKLIVKMSPMLDISSVVSDLPGTTDVYAVGSHRECKELVAVVDLDNDAVTEALIHIWTPNAHLVFTRAEEAGARSEYGIPQQGWYLYEPWPVTQKAAPYKLLCSRFGVLKLSANTHLYTSPDKIDGFPGTCRRVINILPFSSSVLKTFARTYPHIDVAVRNFPMEADILRRKLKVKPADECGLRLMATTVASDNERLMMVLEAMC
ncbi:methyltransferase domain-containing protein [Muribaculum sp.]|uniref:THUMP-like domain-containing protein n=1 Tax=Muribaculum sp. TaxID=1918611 RepID=UPI002580217A|nr:methyltransferase domain-containing protein [Muribaculum sp.]